MAELELSFCFLLGNKARGHTTPRLQKNMNILIHTFGEQFLTYQSNVHLISYKWHTPALTELWVNLNSVFSLLLEAEPRWVMTHDNKTVKNF